MEANQPVTSPKTAVPAAAVPASSLIYAGFWIRLVAVLIDGFVLAVLTSPTRLLVQTPYFSSNGLTGGFWLQLFGAQLIYFAISLAYSVVLTSSSWQGTVGKKALGLKVTDLAGNRLSARTAAIRELAKVLSSTILFIGYIMAAFDGRKQALHDKIASTLVVKA